MAVVIAVLMVWVVVLRTNTMTETLWDGQHYVRMARGADVPDPLYAPFAYRPGMPRLSRLVADGLGVSIEQGFRIVGWIACVALLVLAYGLARQFGASHRQSLFTMLIVGSSAAHTKFPLFFPTLVDVAAYPLMVAAMWALLADRLVACVVIAGVGVFFKEFLAVPLVIGVARLGLDFLRAPSPRTGVRTAVAAAVAAAAIIWPRAATVVAGTAQYVDPVNDPSTLARLLQAPLDGARVFNIAYSVAHYWLPVLMLMTADRLEGIRQTLGRDRLRILAWYVGLVLLLTMYGGTNIGIFVSYTVAAQVVILALVLRQGVGVAEAALVLAATVLFNKLLLHLPSPYDTEAYLDFFGGYDSRVSVASGVRVASMFAAIGSAWVLRRLLPAPKHLL